MSESRARELGQVFKLELKMNSVVRPFFATASCALNLWLAVRYDAFVEQRGGRRALIRKQFHFEH